MGIYARKRAGGAVMATLAFGIAALAGWSGPADAVPAAAGDVVFQPHRAVYDLTLDVAKSGSGVASVNGRIVYELSGSACEGYAQSMRFVTQTFNQEGDMQMTDLRTSSWEEVPARRLRFSTSTYQNDIPAEQTQGTARRAQASGDATVKLQRPTEREATLAGNIYFPIQHSMAIIRSARSGKTILAADLFDGSETGDKIYSTSTAIGGEIKAGSGASIALTKGSGALDRIRSWPISVSYFPTDTGQGDTVPLYEMSYRFHENGVTSSLRINHGDFAIRGELKELTYSEASPCKRPPAP